MYRLPELELIYLCMRTTKGCCRMVRWEDISNESCKCNTLTSADKSYCCSRRLETLYAKYFTPTVTYDVILLNIFTVNGWRVVAPTNHALTLNTARYVKLQFANLIICLSKEKSTLISLFINVFKLAVSARFSWNEYIQSIKITKWHPL